MTLKYHLFLSCEDILINNQKIEDLINKIIEQDPQAGNNGKKIVECMCRHSADIKQLKSYLHNRELSTVYVIDTHKELDDINYWEIGYAMGKGIEIIGYSDGESEKKIPSNIENLIDVPENIKMFIEKMGDILNTLKPKQDIFAQDWVTQLKPAEKEIEGGI